MCWSCLVEQVNTSSVGNQQVVTLKMATTMFAETFDDCEHSNTAAS
jgi:hypothetical protein